MAAAGRHLMVGDLPLNLVQSSDGRYLLVANNGLSKPSITVVDVPSWTVKSTMPLDAAWYGLVRHPTQSRFYVSGAAQNMVQELLFADGTLTRGRTIALPGKSGDGFAGGLAISPDGRAL